MKSSLQNLPLPLTPIEASSRGWSSVDVVFVTGDAYVDHPSFAMGLLGRALEAEGLRVVMLSQPNWRNVGPWKEFGCPNLFFAVSSGNMDSLINHYTANKKVRNDDAYSPGGRIGLRPDRATLVYSQRCREAYSNVPIIIGGVEASLRRLAHYDYWSDTVKRSILIDSKADLLVHGMGEKIITQIAQRLKKGESIRSLRNLRGVAYALGASEAPAWAPTGPCEVGSPLDCAGTGVVVLPSYESVVESKQQFAEATRLIHIHTNPYNAATLTQYHAGRAVVINPPDLPLTEAEMDRIYDLPFSRRPHPSYTEKIPAYEMIKDSVTIMRGCFGGCTFCSITTHQGRIIQSRSKRSIIREIRTLAADPNFHGVISDIGGPTANMYQMRCTRPDIEVKCRRLSCVHPTICKLLGTDHGPLVELMKEARVQKGVKKVFVASGVRMDLAQLSQEYLNELAAHHVGGHLKVAPEHTDREVLRTMKKPEIENFESFASKFQQASLQAKKPKQYLVPYFIASHPGSTLHSMIELALFLKRNGYRPEQVQDFIPAPFDIATCMYYTGIDPFTKKEVYVDKHLKNRRLQRALMQFFKPENYFEVRKALEQAGRKDLIGEHCDALIPSRPPREAIFARRANAHRELNEEYVHASKRSVGYRPGRIGGLKSKSLLKNT